MAEQTSNLGQVEARPSRPIIITILCILNFIFLPIGAYHLIFTNLAREIAPSYPALQSTWYLALFGVSAVITLICFVGLWMMRKWAVYAYTAFTAVNQIVLPVIGLWNVGALIFPAIVIVVMLIYLPRMR